jgi:hypothetical protein
MQELVFFLQINQIRKHINFWAQKSTIDRWFWAGVSAGTGPTMWRREGRI